MSKNKDNVNPSGTLPDGFVTPAAHVNFVAKKLFGESGWIMDGSVAYLEPGGGGPTEQHTHEHSHLFIVIEGKAKILLGDREVVVGPNESFLVDGSVPHSVWNNTDSRCVMVGISVRMS